jgi:23S rRNA (cytosine1962-C5)-methyltransferase
MENRDLIVEGWPDYALLDSGENRKLERYGEFILARPETQALWKPANPNLWKTADAEFRFGEREGGAAHAAKGGTWRKKNAAMPDAWEMSWNSIRIRVRLTAFKHTGIFPEQAANWEWIAERVSMLRSQLKGAPRILNLFGYTGIASLVAARHGAEVTHCDASKQSNTWAHENAELSNLDRKDIDHGGSIRYITDDALKFAEREVRRGAVYDGIILDPPAFGRGAKGEVFRIEEHLPKLLAVCTTLFAHDRPGAFFIVNGYAAGYAPQSLLQAVHDAFPNESAMANGEFGELHLRESSAGHIVPSGIYTRFVNR